MTSILGGSRSFAQGWLVALGLVATSIVSGCGGDEVRWELTPVPSAGYPRGESKAFPLDEARARITGRAMFEGPYDYRPRNPQADAYCARQWPDGIPDETRYVNDDQSMPDVFVYAHQLERLYTFEPTSETVHIDQSHCRYVPHVLGVRVGQPVEIANHDPTNHNVHFKGTLNSSFNVIQTNGDHGVWKFDKAENAKLVCDIHAWMGAQVHIMAHPIFAVTGKDGRFSLPPLPDGHYVIVAEHERYGRQAQEVDISGGKAETLTLTFRPVAASQ